METRWATVRLADRTEDVEVGVAKRQQLKAQNHRLKCSKRFRINGRFSEQLDEINFDSIEGVYVDDSI